MEWGSWRWLPLLNLCCTFGKTECWSCSLQAPCSHWSCSHWGFRVIFKAATASFKIHFQDSLKFSRPRGLAPAPPGWPVLTIALSLVAVSSSIRCKILHLCQLPLCLSVTTRIWSDDASLKCNSFCLNSLETTSVQMRCFLTPVLHGRAIKLALRLLHPDWSVSSVLLKHT